MKTLSLIALITAYLMLSADAVAPGVRRLDGSKISNAEIDATEDKMIPPPAQRFMAERAGATVTEAAGSHAIYVSQPSAVAAIIAKAAGAVKAATN